MARRIGRFRHRVTVLEPVRGEGTTGAPTLSWEPWETRWADVVPLSGKEQEELERRELRITFRIELRFLEGLTAKHRIRLADGRVLEIHDLRSFMERKRYHEALCTEVVDGTRGP